TDERPAVVVASHDEIDLVAALGTVLLLPQLAVSPVDGETLRIAVAIRPDFGTGAGFVDERIVGRRGAVTRNPDDLAEVVVERLRHVAVGEMLAIGEEQRAVRGLHNTAAEVVSPRSRAVLVVDDLHVGEPRGLPGLEPGARPGGAALAGLEPGARQCGAPATVERLGVGKIDGVVLREIAIEDYVQQPALTD